MLTSHGELTTCKTSLWSSSVHHLQNQQQILIVLADCLLAFVTMEAGALADDTLAMGGRLQTWSPRCFGTVRSVESITHLCERRLKDLVLTAAKLLAKKRAHNKHILQQAVSSVSKEGTTVRL